jgi:hypothetical protein
MGWSGFAASALCQHLKGADGQDGGKTLNTALEHILTPGMVDPLVAWAWEPGPGRDPPPETLDQFIDLLKWWKKAGAACT